MSAVTAVSQRYTGRGSGVREYCDSGWDRCHNMIFILALNRKKLD